MGKTFKSQWEFGELFEPAAGRRVYSVTELTGAVRRLIEKEIGQVWVAGEIFDLRPAAITATLGLQTPAKAGWSYRETATYGHFGRGKFPWERTDKAEALRAALKA